MLGAIIGDIVGSAYEFNPTNDYNFELFTKDSKFTDDTICTVAIADAILKGRDYGESLHEWCRKYMGPKGGFGGRFRKWVESDDPQPYGSYGNGSAMRVSPIAWAFPNLGGAMIEAEESAKCSHNHPEGIKGAVATVMAIHYGDEIRRLNDHIDKEVILRAFAPILEYTGYTIDIRWTEVMNKFDETCQGTVPVALQIVANSESFEDAIRRAVSLGADADTLGAIVGSIAEAIWGIPERYVEELRKYLPADMQKVVSQFYQKYMGHSEKSIEQGDPFGFNRYAYVGYHRAEDAQLYYSTGGRTGTLAGRMTPARIDRLEEGEVFVFGSNAQGYHGGGAARAAMDKFGAKWGQGDGLQGQSYAISTMEGLVNTARNVNRFIEFAASHQGLKFYVTPIGCGIAGYNPLQIAPLFSKALILPNVYLPRIFWEYFWMTAGEHHPEYFKPSEDWKRWDR